MEPSRCRAKPQSVVAQSLKEAELVALIFAIKNVLCITKFGLMLRKVMDAFTVQELFEVSIAEDKQTCIDLARTTVLTEMSKRVDMGYQFSFNNISKGYVKLHYVSSESMMADLFTENLAGTKFSTLKAFWGVA